MLRANELLKHGDIISIKMGAGRPKVKLVLYQSDDDFLVVSSAAGASVIIKGRSYAFSFESENNSLYEFEGKVEEFTHFENLPAIKVSISTEFTKIQRRDYYRFPYYTDATYKIRQKYTTMELLELRVSKYKQGEDTDIPEEYISEYAGYILDISGGGVRLRTKHEFAIGSDIDCSFNLEEMEVKFFGKVTRCISTEDGHFEVGIKYTQIDRNIHKQIIAIIFKFERDMISRNIERGLDK